MSVQYMDNFNFYGLDYTKMLDGLPWAAVTGALVADPDVGATGNVLRVGSSNENSNTMDTRLALPAPSAVAGCAFRYYMDTLPGSSGVRPTIFGGRDLSNAKLFDFLIESNGALSLYVGGSLIETTGSPVMAPRSWFHYEFKYNGSTGAYEARIEGVEVLAGTSTAVGNTYLYGFSSRQNLTSNTGALNYMKDFVVWNGLGSQNNDFIGTVAVHLLVPDEDVTNGWTISTGSSWFTMLDDLTGGGSAPDDANYISADDTLPAPSIMEVLDLPADIVGIRAVQPIVRMKKDDGGDATVVTSLISGVSEFTGADHNLTTAYKYWFDVSELDPATGSLWTPVAVNAVQLKLDRTV